MSAAPILLELGVVSVIRLNRPPLNLVSRDMVRALDDALHTVSDDETTRAVVLAAAGDHAFSAGSDIKEFASLGGHVAEKKLIAENEVYNRLAGLRRPTVAALDGDALGGGLELALCCDLRVAAEDVRVGLPEVRLGVIPGAGGTQRLPRLIGLARAKEMVLLGETIDAPTAHDVGLVSRVAVPGGAEAMALDIARSLATRGPVAVREAKGVLDAALDGSLESGLSAELAASERVFASDDMLEGSAAFLEKRPPQFNDR